MTRIHIVLQNFEYEGSNLLSAWSNLSDAEEEARKLNDEETWSIVDYSVRTLEVQ